MFYFLKNNNIKIYFTTFFFKLNNSLVRLLPLLNKHVVKVRLADGCLCTLTVDASVDLAPSSTYVIK